MHAPIFLKKLLVVFLSFITCNISSIKVIEDCCVLLIICLMSQIKQVDKQQLFFTSSILISLKGVWKNPLVHILRLLAGKFGAICTEFPLKTFSVKKFKRIRLQISRQKINKYYLVQNIQSSNFDFPP